MACAWGGLAGYGVCVLLSYFLGQHYSPVNYPVKAIAGYFALALILFAGMKFNSHLTADRSTILEIAVNTILLAIYLAAVLWNERELVGKAVKKLTSRK
jgi:hypothetical protein